MSQLPGIGTERTATPINIFWSADHAVYIPGGRTIIGADSRDPLNTLNPEVLRAGMFMGMNSTSKKMAPAVIGTVYSDKTANNTSLIVSKATGDEIERRIGATGSIKFIGPATDTGAVVNSADVVYTGIAVSVDEGITRVITLASNSIEAMVDGSWICDTDGTCIPICILNEPYGIKVTDANNVSIDVEGAALLIGGLMKSANLINWPVVGMTTLRAWIKAYLRASGPGFAFDDDFGGS